MLEPPAAERAVLRALAAAAAILRRCSPPRLPPRARAAGRDRRRDRRASRSRCSAAASPTSCCGPRTGASSRPASATASRRCPALRVPYRGVDEWNRLVIGLGGTVLAVARGAAAFWPRRAVLGLRDVSLVLLVALYAVPAVALDPTREFLRARCSRCCVVAFLRLERLAAPTRAPPRCSPSPSPCSASPPPRAGHRRAVARLRDVGARRRLGEVDRVQLGPQLRPARLAARRARGAAGEGRAARVLEGDESRRLRRARAGSATARSTRPRRLRRSTDRDADPERGMQRIQVSVRNLRTPTFVTAGVALRDHLAAALLAAARRRRLREREPRAAPRRRLPRARRTRRARTTASAARRARSYPASLRRYRQHRAAQRAARARSGDRGARSTDVHVPAVLRRRSPRRDAGRGPRRPSPAADAGCCDERLRAHLRARAAAPSAVGRRRTTSSRRVAAPPQGDGFTYTETPPRAAVPLDAFLFGDPAGLLPAVLGRDGAAAAHGRRAGARGVRLLAGTLDRNARRVRRPRPRRPLVGGGRYSRLRLGDVRPDARGRARALAARRRGATPRPGAGAARRPRRRRRAPTRRRGARGDERATPGR